MKKIYINLTNHCNLSCWFCCMSSGPDKTRYIEISKFLEILEKEKPDITQLEGGEPLCHPDFLLILGLAVRYSKKEVVIDTNGILLEKFIDSIVKISEIYQRRITIKPSFNEILEGRLDDLKLLLSSLDFLEHIRYEVNVRGKNKEELEKYRKELGWLGEKANYHLFNSYGRLSGKSEYPELQIKDVWTEWGVYSSGGEYFGKDLIKRAIDEK